MIPRLEPDVCNYRLHYQSKSNPALQHALQPITMSSLVFWGIISFIYQAFKAFKRAILIAIRFHILNPSIYIPSHPFQL